jgi:hypothetical protein
VKLESLLAVRYVKSSEYHYFLESLLIVRCEKSGEYHYFIPTTAAMLGKPLSKKRGELIAYLKPRYGRIVDPHFPQIIANAEEVERRGSNGYGFRSDHH